MQLEKGDQKGKDEESDVKVGFFRLAAMNKPEWPFFIVVREYIPSFHLVLNPSVGF